MPTVVSLLEAFQANFPGLTQLLRACLRSVKQLLLQRLSMKEAPHAPALSQRCVTETV